MKYILIVIVTILYVNFCACNILNSKNNTEEVKSDTTLSITINGKKWEKYYKEKDAIDSMSVGSAIGEIYGSQGEDTLKNISVVGVIYYESPYIETLSARFHINQDSSFKSLVNRKVNLHAIDHTKNYHHRIYFFEADYDLTIGFYDRYLDSEKAELELKEFDETDKTVEVAFDVTLLINEKFYENRQQSEFPEKYRRSDTLRIEGMMRTIYTDRRKN